MSKKINICFKCGWTGPLSVFLRYNKKKKIDDLQHCPVCKEDLYIVSSSYRYLKIKKNFKDYFGSHTGVFTKYAN